MLIPGTKVLVTGGSGFLGRHLLPQLLEKGAQVSCLARSPASAARLPSGVIPVFGDCANPEQVAAAARDQEIIIHMAGLLFGDAWRDYLAVNGHMAQNIAAAAKAGTTLRKFIFVSSLAAAGPCAEPPGRKETTPPEPVSAYGWSKLLAEEIITAHLGDKAVLLRPPIIYGSGDRGLLPLFRACGRGLGIGRSFPVSAIHGSDCARAIIHLCGADSRGIYHLNDGHIYTMDDISMAMAKAQGRKSIKSVHPPLPVMKLAAAVSGTGHIMASAVAKILGLKIPAPPQWNLDKYREAAQCGWVADGRRLEQTGFRAQISLDTGMEEAVDFYRREGWL